MVKYDPIFYLVLNQFEPDDIVWLKKYIFPARPYIKSGAYVTILEQFCSLPKDRMHKILAMASNRIQRVMWNAWDRYNEKRCNRRRFNINQELSWRLEKLFESEF